MQIFYVHPGVPAQTLKEFVAHARANPGKLNYASGNPLAIFLLRAVHGGHRYEPRPHPLQRRRAPDHRPGRRPGGNVDPEYPAGISLAKEGRLRVLAVIAGSRVAALPDVPTIAEAGVPEVTPLHWAGIFVPPGMPRAVVERLNKEINVALKTPQLLAQYERYAYTAEGLHPRAAGRAQPRRPRAVAQADQGKPTWRSTKGGNHARRPQHTH